MSANTQPAGGSPDGHSHCEGFRHMCLLCWRESPAAARRLLGGLTSDPERAARKARRDIRFATPFQRRAHAHPIDADEEPGGGQARAWVAGPFRVLVLLTVSREAALFGGRPFWQASVSLGPVTAPSMYDMRKLVRDEAQTLALKQLLRHQVRDVGEGYDRFIVGRVALHLYRALTDAEVAALDPAWLTRTVT